jgi:hypothetical protein
MNGKVKARNSWKYDVHYGDDETYLSLQDVRVKLKRQISKS